MNTVSHRIAGRRGDFSLRRSVLFIAGLLLTLLFSSGISARASDAPGDRGSLASANSVLTRAEEMIEAGDRQDAVELLVPLLSSIDSASAPRLRIVADSLLGRAYLQLDHSASAEPFLREAATLAERSGDAEPIVDTQSDLGLYLALSHDDDAAFAAYARAGSVAESASLDLAQARVEINKADLLLSRGETRLAQQELARATMALSILPVSMERERLSTAIAGRAVAVADRSPQEADLKSALALSRAAGIDAQALGDLRGLSSALGESSRIEDRNERRHQALVDVQRAIFAAQAAQAPDLLYRWEWDEGRIHLEEGGLSEALTDYHRAIETLQPIRHDVMLDLRASGRSYRDEIGPLFLAYSDLLLKRSATLEAPDRQQTLRQVLEAVEQLKTVELEDYFQDDCTTRIQGHGEAIDKIPDHTAVIYPVVLADRLELLVNTGRGIEEFSVAVTGKMLSDEALRLRKLLVKPGSSQYLDSAQKLYRWLIQPLSATFSLKGVDTLVIVPDGALLGVPFAALHDGTDFLIRRYAIATVPGLRWVDLRRMHGKSKDVLVGGLSEAVQGFPALPGVEIELQDIAKFYGAELLDNQRFTEPNIEHAFGGHQFSVVHIASHAKFANEASKSFLLTYDGRIGMDSLERVIGSGSEEDSVDLLTLSACETAAGDERAALGLAGVAIKAGARSVVATLWSIDDEAASELIREFYRQLGLRGVSKAKALQAAELHLLSDPRFQHPGYWAPFLVIGDWT